MNEMNESANTDWYFTAPWDPISVRRGDALGFRAGADYFADLLAPDLSNSTIDARWIALLSWCLQWSHVAWRNAGGGDLSCRDGQRERYAWLRPLELLWVARTLKSGQDTGQLRGRQSSERWFATNLQSSDFDMSSDQFRRYRQIGMYGAYRVVFRIVDGLTTGDGWTPSDTALKLAKLVNDSLPSAARLSQEHFESRIQWGRWSGGGEARYWVERGWKSWDATGGFLPTPKDSVREPLPQKERELLEPVLFGDGSIRRISSNVLASAKGAKTHTDLCEALAQSSALSKALKPSVLASLPAFSRFADAAMDAMRGLWDEINQDKSKPTPALSDLSRSHERFKLLRDAGQAWLNTPGRSEFPHEQVVNELAEAMCDASTTLTQLQALTRHHAKHGGGRRWFVEKDGKLVRLVEDTGIAASNYRFRLLALCRLAAQCGVADMHSALNVLESQNVGDDFDDEEDAQ